MGRSSEARNPIVAKVSDGQRYPLPLSKCMLSMEVRGAAAPKEPMTYALRLEYKTQGWD